MINKIKNLLFPKRDPRDVSRFRDYGVRIGDGCEIYENVSFGSEPYLVTIGNHVRITAGVKFITHDGGVWVVREMMNMSDIDKFGAITIGNNVHIGMNSIIMPGVSIGDNCIIGCGAVVTKNVPPYEIWGGVPARKIKTVAEYFQQHEHAFEHTKQMNSDEKKAYLIKKYCP